MSTVKIKADDTAITFTNPRYRAAGTLSASDPGQAAEPLAVNGVTLNLTGATILFLMKLIASPYTAYSLAASIDGTATAGNVTYTSASGFPTVVGQYKQEWQVTQSGGTILTFPSGGYNIVHILDDLN